MKTMRCYDAALITIAQETVDHWRADPSQSLLELLAELERSPWPGLALTPGQRRALREMVVVVLQDWDGESPSATSVATIVHTNSARDQIPA